MFKKMKNILLCVLVLMLIQMQGITMVTFAANDSLEQENVNDNYSLSFSEATAVAGGIAEIEVYSDGTVTEEINSMTVRIQLISDLDKICLNDATTEGEIQCQDMRNASYKNIYPSCQLGTVGKIGSIFITVPCDAVPGEDLSLSVEQVYPNEIDPDDLYSVQKKILIHVEEGTLVDFTYDHYAYPGEKNEPIITKSVSKGEDIEFSVVPSNEWTEVDTVTYEGDEISPSNDGTYVLKSPESGHVIIKGGWKESFLNAEPDLTIGTAEELRLFGDQVNKGNSFAGKLVRLNDDIDLNDYPQWEAIGTEEKPFKGIFDGANHTITTSFEYTHTKSDTLYYGIFGFVGNGGVCRLTTKGTLNLYNESFSKAPLVGGISARMYESWVMDCTNEINFNFSGDVITRYESDPKYYRYSLGTVWAGGITSKYYACDEIYCGGCVNRGNMQFGTSEKPVIAYAVGIASCKIAIDCINEGDFYSQCDLIDASDHDGRKKHLNSSYCMCGISCVKSGKSYIINSCNTGDLTANGRDVAGIEEGVGGFARVWNCYNTGSIYNNGNRTLSFPIYTYGIGGQIQHNCYNIGTVTDETTEEYLSDPPTKYGASDEICIENCATYNGYRKSESFTASDLGPAFKEDNNAVNSGYPLLFYQVDSGAEEELYKVNLVTSPSDAIVKVFQQGVEIDSQQDGSWLLKNGNYTYTVSEEGYQTVNGSFKVKDEELKINVVLKELTRVILNTLPEGGTIVVENSDGKQISSEEDDSYLLVIGEDYTYKASEEGYFDEQGGFTVKKDLEVSINMKRTDSVKGVIFGDGNGKDSDHPYIISEDGTYRIGTGATGKIYIEKDAKDVELIGEGVQWNAEKKIFTKPFSNLHIDATAAEGVNLTLSDIYIRSSDEAHGIDFNGSGNNLTIEGVVVYDLNLGGGASSSVVHVDNNTELTISGSGEMYMYKDSGGTAIGGKGAQGLPGEMNGKLIFDMTGKLFAKGTRQGAVVGSGANASLSDESPGDIIFKSGEYNFVAVARGSVIGGGAGTKGANAGNVYVEEKANVNINVDFSGAAIGGGGHDNGNDADGGTLFVSGGSLRVYLDENAAAFGGWSEPDGSKACAGINDVAITADKKNLNGEQVSLLVVDPADLGVKDNHFTVQIDHQNFYEGGLPSYGYIQEGMDKDQQFNVTSTVSNWYNNEDTCLYFYVSEKNHTIDINGYTFLAEWNSETNSFTVSSDVPQIAMDSYAGKMYLVKYSRDVEEGKIVKYNNKEMSYSEELHSWVTVVDSELEDASNTDITIVEGVQTTVDYSGDVNQNGIINIIDAQAAYDIAKGLYYQSDLLTEAMWLSADVNKSGTVTSADARVVQCIIHGIEV